MTPHVPIARFNFNWRDCYIKHMRFLPSSSSYPTIPAAGRLLVLDMFMEVLMYSPNGSWKQPMHHTGGTIPERRNQPSWSPDGRYISWSRLRSENIYVDIADSISGHIRTWPVNRPAFYYYWSPDSTKLLYLCFNDEQLETRMIDLYETPEPESDEDKTDRTSTIFTHEALYLCFCPIPGADRYLGNVPSAFSFVSSLSSSRDMVVLGMASNSYSPSHLTFETIPSALKPQYPLRDSIPDMAAYRTPFWTINNTMIVAINSDTEKHKRAIIAFDSIWDPSYDGRKLSEIYRDDGIEAVARIMRENPPDKNVDGHPITLPIPASSFVLLESEKKYIWVASPNGRLLCCFTKEEVVIIRLLYEETASTDSSSSSPLTFSPKKLIGSKVIFSASMAIFGALFSPNGQCVLFFTKDGHNSEWKSLELPESDVLQPIVTYASFRLSPVFRTHFLPFNAQHSLSMSLFSPDSTHFTYASEGRVFVQKLHFGEGAPSLPIEIGEGHLSAWSPR